VRIDKAGRIARTAHPKAFGSPLTNPHITLDFAEAQLEFITPPLKSESSLKSFLENLYAWSSRNVGGEFLWPFSMPPRLPQHKKIALADFGTSTDAHIKNLYREGLKQRYGGAVQTISGIHYNFSLSESFWAGYAKERGVKGNVSDFRNEQYFALIRNVIRFVPLVTYLFGASPAADKSFFTTRPSTLRKLDASTYFGPYATSLRLSDFGYHNAKRSPVKISYNSLPEYLDDLYLAISTPSKVWSALGASNSGKKIQLNTNILQLENEFYASIRPKQKKHTHAEKSVLCSLACCGVEYVELRSIDLDPFEPSGIGKEQLYFLHAFMLYCLFTPSPRFKGEEQRIAEKNNARVALLGRKAGLSIMSGLRTQNFSSWTLKTLDGIKETAGLLDKVHGTDKYSRAVEPQRVKLLNPDATPSAKVIREIKGKKMSYAAYGVFLAKAYALTSRTKILPPSYTRVMEKQVLSSLKEASRREAYDAWILKGFEHLELSTQVIIRAARKRGIEVMILDETLNVIELKKGKKSEIVKQGTITRYDTYLSFELMNDKSLTKLFLTRAGVSTPQGGRFTTEKEARNFYAEHKEHALVVKPARTNFGTGVFVVERGQEKKFIVAVKRAFTHDSTILVEEFIPGKEYRFLVIAGKVVAVLHRDPANVVGDGVHTVRELVARKNADPKSYKLPSKYIKLGLLEREMLTEAKLKPASIPARGQKVYVRKNSNIDAGGDPVDIADMPAGYKKIAREAARSVGANICGVDMIIKNSKKKSHANNYSIIELNWNPAIYMHAYPVKGAARDVGGAVLDFLGF
jgi:glutamate--cysteine ligase